MTSLSFLRLRTALALALAALSLPSDVFAQPVFTEHGATILPGLDIDSESRSASLADIDDDGDQDLIAPTNELFPERVFLSDASENGNHWLYVRLNGPIDNTTGIGAALYVTLNDGTPQERTLRREANTNAGTFNQSDLPVHFGLGAADSIDQLRVVWPDGTV